ncbi:YqjD family protein [Paraburkholderia denitrificans]|uniref:YqjD family protein n=1 Tax=Paraburkholderia denitrificans TaxID=694025 RepID=A0ABW0JDM9_9BURK
MSAFPNTRDAIGESWSKTGRHARRIARRSRNAVADIADELRDLLAELETTLGEGTQADAAALREDVRKRLDAARERLEVARTVARERADEAFSNADDYVHRNPWQSIAIAGGLALIVGALIARGRQEG